MTASKSCQTNLRLSACCHVTSMDSQKQDIRSEADISQLIEQFYGRVREDTLLGPIFDGVAQVDWAHHIPRLVSFWSTVLLGSPDSAERW